MHFPEARPASCSLSIGLVIAPSLAPEHPHPPDEAKHPKRPNACETFVLATVVATTTATVLGYAPLVIEVNGNLRMTYRHWVVTGISQSREERARASSPSPRACAVIGLISAARFRPAHVTQQPRHRGA